MKELRMLGVCLLFGGLGTGCSNSQTAKNRLLIDAGGCTLTYPEITTTSNGTTVKIGRAHV